MLRLTLVSAFLLLALVSEVTAANMFDEVPRNHWAYNAVRQLEADWSRRVVCFNDPTKCPIQTRYGFAVGIKWIYTALAGNDKAEREVTLSQLLSLRKLTDEFKDELALVDMDAAAMRQYLNSLLETNQYELDVQNYPELAEMPKDHWAYESMKQLYAAGIFEGDQK